MNKLLKPVYAYPMAAWSFLQSGGQIPRWLRVSDKPLPACQVPGQYVGINIATSEDPAVDDYLLSRLEELGITQVRMDFSYDSVNGAAERLLNRVLDAGISVLLEIFPPQRDARSLFSDETAKQRWSDFLSSIFSRYHQRIALFEIGSTPNRGRWSGFSFLSYQATWSIACEQATHYGIALAGPNVSDFEPFYNASLLHYMKRVGRTATAHTDNLFVERVIEPEAFDHRVLGRFATHRLKLNLIKKARILQQIGRDNGALETLCTYKCWTTKRLARRSPFPEQKRVDYLLRYLALACSSGALKQVYWGPLICSRDGLISDGSIDYPVIDQVSYYQKIHGELADFTVTPGFHALRYAISVMSGARCEALYHHPYGLSLFRFKLTSKPDILMCWCRDGQSWPLDRVFAEDDLSEAVFVNSLGNTVARPVVISEQPLFIEFHRQDVTPDTRGAATLPKQNVIHLSSPDYQSVGDEIGSWRGASMLRAAFQQQDKDGIPALRPDILPTLEETAVLRDTRNRIWNVSDPREICDQLSIKLNRVSGIKRLTYRFRPSKGRRHWNNACEMLRRGIRTPLPVTYYEQTQQAGIRDSWYLCEFIPGAFSAKDVYAAFRGGAQEYRGLSKNEWYQCLAQFVCEMHNRQIVHRDLSAGNMLVTLDDEGNAAPYLIDIGRAWLGNGSGLKARHRLQDLMRFCYKLDWTGREAFVHQYQTHLGKSLPGWWRIPFHYYDNKQLFKKTLKGKRKKRAK